MPEALARPQRSSSRLNLRGIRAAVLTTRFLCELAMLAALAYAGFELGGGAAGLVLGIGAPVLAACVWGAFVAPKAKWPVSTPTRLGIELVLFGAAVAGLFAVDQPVLAVILGVAAAATSLANAADESDPADAFS